MNRCMRISSNNYPKRHKFPCALRVWFCKALRLASELPTFYAPWILHLLDQWSNTTQFSTIVKPRFFDNPFLFFLFASTLLTHLSKFLASESLVCRSFVFLSVSSPRSSPSLAKALSVSPHPGADGPVQGEQPPISPEFWPCSPALPVTLAHLLTVTVNGWLGQGWARTVVPVPRGDHLPLREAWSSLLVRLTGGTEPRRLDSTTAEC